MTSSPDLTMATIKMVASLILVLGLLWGIYILTRRKMAAGNHSTRGEMIQLLENRHLGLKKSIALVRVPGACLVLGVSADRINLLNRIEDPEILSDLDAKRTQKIQPSFISIFQRATYRQATRDDNPAKSPAFISPRAD